MLLTEKGRALLKEHEGWRLNAYYDTRGYRTIGCGHNCEAQPYFHGKLIPDRIDEDYAERLFKHDILLHEGALLASHGWIEKLDPVRRDILINMCFNMGPAEFPGHWPNLMEQIRKGDYHAAAMNMRASKWYKQVKLRGITLVRMMETGQYPDA